MWFFLCWFLMSVWAFFAVAASTFSFWEVLCFTEQVCFYALVAILGFLIHTDDTSRTRIVVELWMLSVPAWMQCLLHYILDSILAQKSLLYYLGIIFRIVLIFLTIMISYFFFFFFFESTFFYWPKSGIHWHTETLVPWQAVAQKNM